MAEANSALTADQLSELQTMFYWLDKEKSNFVTVGDLESFLVSWRKIVSVDDVKKLIEGFDVDKSGRVGFQLFVNVVVQYDKIFKDELCKELSSTFKMIDDNRTGFIRVEDLLTVFNSNEYSVSLDYVNATIQEINPSNEERVNYKHFIETFIC